MTKENPQKIEKLSGNFEISNDKIDKMLDKVKKIEELLKSKAPKSVKKVVEDELDLIVDELIEANEERKQAFKKLKIIENPGTAVLEEMDEIRRVFNLISGAISPYIEKEDENSESEEVIEFKTPTNVLNTYPDFLKRAKEAGVTEAVDVYIKNIKEAKKERVVLVSKLEKNPDLKIKDDAGNEIKLEDLKKDITMIEGLLSTSPESQVEETVSDNPVVTEEDSKKEDIPVESPVTKEEVEKKQEVLTEDAVEEEVSEEEELKNYKYTSIIPKIREYGVQLKKKITVREKEEIDAFISNQSKKISYRKSVLDNASIPDVASKEYKGIIQALSGLAGLSRSLVSAEIKEGGVEEESKNTEITEDKEQEKVVPERTPEELEKLVNVFTPGAVNLNSTHKKLGGKKDLEEETEPETEPEFESEVFTSYGDIIKSIIKNENPEARAIFLNEHGDIIKDLRDQINSINKNGGVEGVNTFITEQQSEINSLIKLLVEFGSDDTNENGLMLNALRSDLEVLEASRLKEKPEDKAAGNKPAPAPNPEPNPEPTPEPTPSKPEEINLDDFFPAERMEILKSNKSLHNKFTKAVEDYNTAVFMDPESEITKTYLEAVTKLNKEFLKYEKEYNLKKPAPAAKPNSAPEKNKNEEWAGYTTIDIDNPKQRLFYISYENHMVMKSREGYFDRLMEAINEHNENISNKVDEEVLVKSMRKIKGLKAEFREIKQEWEENIKKKKKGGRPSPSPSPEPAPTPEPAPDDEPEEKEVKLFYPEEGKNYSDYHEILSDAGFDSWLDNMKKTLKDKGVSIESEIKSLDEWYKEYQEVIPYVKKLDTVFEDVKKKDSKDKLTLMMTQKKINELLYRIHTSGEYGKDKVDEIYAKYQEVKKEEEEIASIKKLKELSEGITSTTSSKSKKELTTDQVKKIFEARGIENVEENIEELLVFLRDMHHNYGSFYANKNENVTDDMRRVYEKYKAASEENHGEKMGWFSKKAAKFSSLFSFSLDAIDYDNTTILIKKVRDLNLVDRKSGNFEKTKDNKLKMEKLISFINDHPELLTEHILNPESNKEAELDAEQKELLKTFDGMYKTFSETRYRGRDSKEKAKEILKSSKIETETEENTTDMSEIFFDDTEEVEQLKKEATRQLATEALVKLKGNLDNFPTTGKNIPEWVKLSKKFDDIKSVFDDLEEELTDDTTITVKNVTLKLEDLKLRHVNKDNFKDLSANFALYEKIVNSPDRKKEEKEKAINDLLAALEKLFVKVDTTKIQKGVIGDIIKKYKEILINIK